MPVYYKEFKVSGSANSTVWDTGISGTETEKKRIISIIITVSDYKGNLIKGTVERVEVLKIYDYNLDTFATSGSTNTVRSTDKIIEIPLDIELDQGETFKVGIECGSNATDIYGAYKYEAIGK